MKFRITLLCALIILPVTLHAGRLSPELAQQIQNVSGDSLVRVWIELPSTPHVQQLRASAAMAASLSVQHSAVITALKADNSASQVALRDKLDALASNGKAQQVKSHWIANVIEARVAATDLADLAARPDVAAVYSAPEIVLIQPVEMYGSETAAGFSGTYMPNLKRIKADSAHIAGYSGQGRLICSFDTGVDGNHPVIRTRWRGYGGSSEDSAASFYDPVDHYNYAHVPSTSFSASHGTHVMGILVGRDTTVTPTKVYGVAPDARWISAAVIDVGGASILDAFEWAADPDGDPNTLSDMPDVINHSWGYQVYQNYELGCKNVFYDAIDNLEALGIVNIFAAGNTGVRGSSTIYNPANRSLDSLDCFAVGNVDTLVSPSVAPSSSRGPSDCEPSGHKPNVVAPGTSILSCVPNNLYSSMTGTSMAAPHVSGLVALLRQKNPNASVTQIKEAILTSAQPHGWSSPNDSTGWGEIDCMAALNALPANPVGQAHLKLYDFVCTPIVPGIVDTGVVVITNTGTAIANTVSATVTGSNPSIVFHSTTVTFGDIAAGATVSSSNGIRFTVSDTVTPGSVLSVPLTIGINGTPALVTTLSFVVTPVNSRSIATHNTGQIMFSLSNFGVYGLYGHDPTHDAVPLGGAGFDFNSEGNSLYESGLMATTGPGTVVSAVHSYLYSYDDDFKVCPGGNLQFSEPGAVAAQQTYSILSDTIAHTPIGLRFTQESFSNSSPHDDYIIMRYVVRNTTSSSISSLRIGMFVDWDINGGASNSGGFNKTDSILWMAYNSGSTTTPSLSNYRGLVVLDGPLSSAFTDAGPNIYLATQNSGYDGFTPFEKYTSLTNGTATDTSYAKAKQEIYQVIAAGPTSIAAGGLDTVAFALLAGQTYADVQSAATAAQRFYDSVVAFWMEVPDNPTVLPESYILHQNYPNPFNPGTTICFDLPRAADYRLTVFDLLGRKVDEFAGHARAGRVTVRWDGSHSASGVYLYRLTAGEFVQTRKMLLLK